VKQDTHEQPISEGTQHTCNYRCADNNKHQYSLFAAPRYYLT
jgi:hypothetical protein